LFCWFVLAFAAPAKTAQTANDSGSWRHRSRHAVPAVLASVAVSPNSLLKDFTASKTRL